MMKKEAANDQGDKAQHNIKELKHSIRQMENGFTRMANVVEQFSEVCIKKLVKRPFFKQPSFWTAFIAVSGLIGLMLTWQQQVKAVDADNIRKQIMAIQAFKLEENEAMSKSRVLIINQTLDCPTKNSTLLKKMQQARNNSLIDVITYNSGIDGSNGGVEVWSILRKFVSDVYNINGVGICKINPNKLDHKLMALQMKVNYILEKLKIKFIKI